MPAYKHPRPAVTADVAIFTMHADDLAVLLIRRGEEPFKGAWALPGGHVEPGEPLERAAHRELEEETGVTGLRLEQLGAYGDPGRDPRGHYVSVVYYTFVVAEGLRPRAGDDAVEVAWHPLRTLPFGGGADGRPTPARASKRPRPPGVEIAFDHLQLIERALFRLRERMDDPLRASHFNVVPRTFTLAELQRVYEVLHNRTFDKRNFRARLLARNLIEPLSDVKTGRHRPARLYRWRAFEPTGD